MQKHMVMNPPVCSGATCGLCSVSRCRPCFRGTSKVARTRGPYLLMPPYFLKRCLSCVLMKRSSDFIDENT